MEKSYAELLADLDALEVEADQTKGGLDGEEQGLFDRARSRLKKRIDQDNAQFTELATAYRKK